MILYPTFRRRRRHALWLLTGLLLLVCTVETTTAQEMSDTSDAHDESGLSSEEILLRVFGRTGDYRWTLHENWLDADVCTYSGITCYTAEEDFAGHVREVNLSENNLAGTMPGEIFELPYLETLLLQGNPDLVVQFDNVGQAQHLKQLVVSGTGTDTLQGIGGAAQSLQTLHIDNLDLTGPIPEAIFQLTNLRGLFANNNKFSGQLSASIGNFFYMTDLDLDDNELEGPIPTQIGQMVNLQSLSLGDNGWSGPLPTQLDQCTDLRTLSINRNKDNPKGGGLTGSLLEFSAMANINKIDLSNQKLSGNIPDLFLATAPKDKPIQVDLRGNQLSGNIPNSLTDKTALTILLADNSINALSDTFCAQVPQWMGGSVGSIGCNAILCPPGTYNAAGRQTSPTDTCETCAGSSFAGSTTCEAATTTDQFERETLVRFYNQMGGPYWKSSTNWLSPATDVCSWFGIQCNSSRKVVAIRLRNNDLTKTPPSDIFRLPELRALDLAENTLNFSFQGIENARNLQTLDLTQTDLKSLDGIGGLAQTQIGRLALGSNILEGVLPDAVFSLINLEELDVSHNFFTGALSASIGNLVNLKRLYLFGNSFNGALPATLGQLDKLTEFRAGENSFSGELPDELGNLSELQVLSLHQTTTDAVIGGNLPSFANLQQLTSLQLAGNALEGNLPSDFLQNTLRGSSRIEVLLGDNLLSGSIPSAWSQRFDELLLDLTGNRISGFGDGICSQTGWMDGSVQQFGCDAILCPVGKFNEFGRQSTTEGECRDCGQANVLGAKVCGSVPITKDGEEIEALQDLFDATHGNSWTKLDGWKTSGDYCSWYGITCDSIGRVTKIGLADNGLTGTPPRSIFSLSFLQEIDFGKNQISFSFEGIEAATALTKLRLTSTNLNLIRGLEKAQSLVDLEIDDNDIGGTFPDEFLALTNLRRLSANYNNLAGRIPSSLSSLKALTELSLFHNRLTGPLPAAIGGMINLKVLALSENNFEGTIPLDYNDLINLEFLSIQREGGTDGSDGNIGVNQGASEDEGAGLSGPLPSFDQLKNLRHLYLGVNSLTGEIPDNFLGAIDVGEIVVDLTSNRLKGGIPGALARFDKMTLFVAGNRITEAIPEGICRKTGWMNGQVGTTGCNSILCPVNTANDLGRQTESSGCITCSGGGSTPYLGSFDCRTSQEKAESEERLLLEEFYRETHGDNWRKNDYWVDPDISICSWYGITCVSSGAESVQSIELMQNGLTGRIPSSIFRLPNLKELNVAENAADVSFTGIQSAQNLQYLNIDSMSLSSLNGLGQAPSLIQLHAASNNFGPQFPPEILALAGLEVVYLSHNKFEGNIPSDGSNWADLKSFSCENCGLSGFVPAVVWGWSKLERLNLADNEYNGPFPQEIEALQGIQYVDISRQRSPTNFGLTGFLPSFANRTTPLRELYLSENEFFGTIPSNFLSLVSSTEVHVDLRRNQLNGTIPTALGRFQGSTFLFADNLLGLVPTQLCSLGWNDPPPGSSSCDFVMCPVGYYNGIGRATSDLPCEECSSGLYTGTTGCGDVERDILKELYISTEGSQWVHNDNWDTHLNVCAWYGVTCHTDANRNGLVQKLDLRGNNMVGTLSSRIWLLTEMEELDLADNDLRLQSFEKIGDAPALSSLKLSNNYVESLLGIGQATALKNFHCTSCEIHGNLPDEFFSLTGLERLFFNYNSLEGPVTGFGGMRSLVEIYLYGNRLSGELPPYFGSRFVEVISVGRNFLSGPIPITYNAFFRLRVFSAEYEEPDYAIPEDFQIVDAQEAGLAGELPAFDNCPELRELYLAGNGIGGTIPSKFLASVEDKSATMHVDISSNFVRGEIPSSLKDFQDLRLIASDNPITAVSQDLCDMSEWMDGLLASGCDALLCPPGTFNEVGRRTASYTCEPCDHRGADVYYGATTCGPIEFDFSEKDVLEEFFDTAGGPVWKDKSGWKSSAPICEWFGIKCTTDSEGQESVSEVSLPSNNLVNRVAAKLLHLANLRVLDISGNPIAMSFGEASLAVNLEELNISGTNVVSVKGIGGARSLTKLVMNNNAFYGENIPEELFLLTNLVHLDISHNGFVGSLDPDLSELRALEVFDASDNDLAGSIPDSWGSIARLRLLDLSENLLHGDIPSSINSLYELESLDMSARTRSNVGLSGTLPPFISLKKLRYLDVGANSLTGTVPTNLLMGVDAPDQQITVLLDSNTLHGTIPIDLNRFSRLNIDLADNEIEGIAPGLCEMTLWWDGAVAQHECDAILCPAGTYNELGRQDSEDNRCVECPGEERSTILGSTKCPALQKAASKKILEDLYAATGGPNWNNRENWMTHPDICVWNGVVCKDGLEIVELNLGSNNLSGKPPKEIFELYGLKNLKLYSNPIDFSFEGIVKASTLENLQLDSIGLKSLEGIGNAPAISYLDLRFNSLNGRLTSELEKLTNLETLLISHNDFFGPLPSFDSNRRLTTLKAGGNGFTGPLPSFSIHPNLRTLDVTDNQLNGDIPGDLLEGVDITKSVLLNLAQNKFSGNLPATLARFDDLTITVSDNEITGIDGVLCDKEKWNGGDVELFGCDAILCPPQSYAASIGRASSASGDCKPCAAANFFGHSVCLGSAAVGMSLATILGVLVVSWLALWITG